MSEVKLNEAAPQRYLQCSVCRTVMLWPSRERAPDQGAQVELLTLGVLCCDFCPGAPTPVRS